jgi:hypothetical protein
VFLIKTSKGHWVRHQETGRHCFLGLQCLRTVGAGCCMGRRVGCRAGLPLPPAGDRLLPCGLGSCQPASCIAAGFLPATPSPPPPALTPDPPLPRQGNTGTSPIASPSASPAASLGSTDSDEGDAPQQVTPPPRAQAPRAAPPPAAAAAPATAPSATKAAAPAAPKQAPKALPKAVAGAAVASIAPAEPPRRLRLSRRQRDELQEDLAVYATKAQVRRQCVARTRGPGGGGGV